MYFWKRRKIKIKIIFKSFTFNTKNDKLIAKLKILNQNKETFIWNWYSLLLLVTLIQRNFCKNFTRCATKRKEMQLCMQKTYSPSLSNFWSFIHVFFLFETSRFFFKYLFFEYSWKVKIEIKRFQFYVEVYRYKSFTSSNLLFQLEDLVSDKATSFPWDELDHKGLKVPYIG